MTDKAREEFEAWFKHNYQWFIKQGLVVYGLERSKDPLNHYAHPIPNHDYRVWLASRDAIAVELPVFDDYPASIDAEMRESLRVVIEAAGLKVKP